MRLGSLQTCGVPTIKVSCLVSKFAGVAVRFVAWILMCMYMSPSITIPGDILLWRIDNDNDAYGGRS